MDSVSPSYMEDLSNLDSLPSPPVEVWPLSSALFGAEPWVLRMCLVTPSLPNIASLQLDEANVVALNAKSVAGKRHIVAGVHNLVRDFQAKRGTSYIMFYYCRVHAATNESSAKKQQLLPLQKMIILQNLRK